MSPTYDFQVGDRIRFDHFGAHNRDGRVVKVTPKRIYIEWRAPASGKVRIVSLRWSDLGPKNAYVIHRAETTKEETP